MSKTAIRIKIIIYDKWDSKKRKYYRRIKSKKSISLGNSKNEITEISKQIIPIAEEIRHCNNIKQRMEEIKKYQ